jgi:Restriction endonuclease
MKIPSVLAGVAGEYFVAAELSRRGHIASISLRNTRGIDIIATNKAASRSVTIQCKTNQLTRKIGAHDGNDWTRLSALHVFRFGY